MRKEFADPFRLRGLIRRYSDHIGFPVRMRKEGEASLEYEVVNQAKALWTLPRTQIKDEEYRQFYQYVAHDFQDPVAWSHNKVEGKREYTSLLYLPAKAPFDLWQRDAARGLKLYVRRVFIMDDAEQFLPPYLRFVKGVVDSSDLPLNVSREILQQDPEVEAIKGGLTKRVLDLLARLAKDEPEKYAAFWKEFGAVLKEGVVQDHANQPALLALMRFASTHQEHNNPDVTLADYLARMKPGQDKIYYVIAESPEAARGSPAIERLRERGLEVLLLSERIDEWVMGQLNDFEGKRFKDATRGALELGGLANEADRKEHDEQLKESKGLLKRVKDALGERVTEVRVSERLRESPSCLVLGEDDMGEQMRRILAAAGQKAPQAHPVLELNVTHPLVKYLDGVSDAGAVRRARAAAVRPGRPGRGHAAAQPARVRAAPEPPARAPRRIACGIAGGGTAPAARRAREDPRPRRGARGAHRDPAGRGRLAGARLRRGVPPAPALRGHPGQQGGLHRGACVPAVRRPGDPLQLPRRGRQRRQLRRGPRRDRRYPGGDRLRAAALAAGATVAGRVLLRRRRRRARRRGRRPARLVLVAPAVNRIDVGGEPAPGCPWLIVQGDADELVPARRCCAGPARSSPPPAVTLLPGTGHFFHGRINELRAAMLEFMHQAQQR